jgi:hypothetical protein
MAHHCERSTGIGELSVLAIAGLCRPFENVAPVSAHTRRATRWKLRQSNRFLTDRQSVGFAVYSELACLVLVEEIVQLLRAMSPFGVYPNTPHPVPMDGL